MDVKFKKGLEIELASATKVEGAYYQCTDTGRLYLCIKNDSNELVFIEVENIIRDENGDPTSLKTRQGENNTSIGIDSIIMSSTDSSAIGTRSSILSSESSTVKNNTNNSSIIASKGSSIHIPDSPKVEKYSSKSKFPAVGERGTFYVDESDDRIYLYINGEYSLTTDHQYENWDPTTGQSIILASTNSAINGEGYNNAPTYLHKGTNDAIIAASSSEISGNKSAIIGGHDNEVQNNYAAIIGGTGNTVSHDNVVILGGTNIQSDRSDVTVMHAIELVEKNDLSKKAVININSEEEQGTQIFNLPQTGGTLALESELVPIRADVQNATSIANNAQAYAENVGSALTQHVTSPDAHTDIRNSLANKVDKVEGKGLSTNDYTTTEKNKLAGIAAGAEVNQNAFSNVVVGSTTLQADSKTDTLTIAAGNNITIATDASTDTLTISAASGHDTTYTFTQDPNDGHKITLTPSSGTATTLTIPDNDHITTASTTGSGNAVTAITANANGALTVSKGKTFIETSAKGVANGVATLDSDGKVPSSQLPSYVDDVLEYNSKSAFPTTGESGKIYVDKSTNLTYRWSGSAYVEISPSLALGETSSTAYAGDKGKAVTDAFNTHSSNTTIHITEEERAAWNAKGSSDLALGETSTTAYRGDRGKIAYDHSQTTHAPSNAQANVIETIKVNGSALTPSSKAVNITVPTNNNQLTNGAGYITGITKTMVTTALGYTPPTEDTNTTYTLSQDSADGHKITLTPSSGTATTITIPDKDTTYTAGTGLSMSGTTINHSNSVTAGTASEGGSARTLAFGGTFNVPSVTYDAQGHITGKGSVKLTMPANPNTDTNQTVKVGSTAFGSNDAVGIVAGTNVTVTPDTANKTITIAAKDTTYSSKTAASGGTDVSLVTTGEKYTWNNKGTYSKPSGGIPKSDLASAVQTSLGKADTALQSYTETDPVFAASAAADITSTDLTNWGAAYTHSQAAHAPSNAEVNQNAFSNVVVGSTTIAADSKTDTLTLVAGSNVTLTPDATNDKITIAATDTTYSSKTAASGGTDVSLVTTGEKYTWNSKTSNTGTVTSVAVKMNGTTKGTVTTSGTIDLGTVITAHQDISGKADKSSTVTNVSYDTSSKKIQKTINGTTSDVVTLAAVATSGSYNDLSNKPTLPTVNNGTLTIKAAGTSKGTFTANQSGNTEVNITASDLGLSSAMAFGGVLSSLPTPSTTDAYSNGTVVLVGNKEYVRSGKTSSAAGSWVELGDESSYALKSITVTGTGALGGGGSLEANRNITHNTSGVTAGTYRSVTVNTYGHVTAGSNPTTLSGYGITDAKIESGVITLGSNTITPLTSHQSLAAYLKIDGSNATGNGLSAMINKLSTGDSIPSDNDYVITQYVNGGTTTTTYHRRPISKIWQYIKGKADSVYAASGHTHATSLVAGGTATVNLAANTAYTLTAGGTTVIFKTPADNNTDTKVTQTNSTDNNTYRLLLSGNANDTTETATARKSTAFKANPSSGNLSVTGALHTGKGIHANTDNAGNAGGLSLYGTDMTLYGVAMRQTSNLGKHGYVSQDWATYFIMSPNGTNINRGWIFRNSSKGNVASICSDTGDMATDGKISLGCNGTDNATKPVTMQYNTTDAALDFIFA